MEENLYDMVIDGLHEMRGLVRNELFKQYRKTKPFREEPLSNDEQLWIYNNMAPEDVEYARQKYGDLEVGEFVKDMEMFKGRRDKNA